MISEQQRNSEIEQIEDYFRLQVNQSIDMPKSSGIDKIVTYFSPQEADIAIHYYVPDSFVIDGVSTLNCNYQVFVGDRNLTVDRLIPEIAKFMATMPLP